MDRLEVGQRDQTARVAQGPPDQSVEALVGLVLVQLKMAGWMERDHSTGAGVGVNAERDLLDHRAAGHEHGSGLAEQGADFLFEHTHGPAVAIDVDAELVRSQRGDLGERLGRRAKAVTTQRPIAGLTQLSPLGRGEVIRVGGRLAPWLVSRLP